MISARCALRRTHGELPRSYLHRYLWALVSLSFSFTWIFSSAIDFDSPRDVATYHAYILTALAVVLMPPCATPRLAMVITPRLSWIYFSALRFMIYFSQEEHYRLNIISAASLQRALMYHASRLIFLLILPFREYYLWASSAWEADICLIR